VTFATTDFGYYVRLEPGDELICSLIQLAREQEVDAALLTAVGSLTEVELGSGSSRDRLHARTHLAEPLDACSITGTLTLVDGEPFPHLHGSFARADHTVVGGHIYQAVSGSGIEIAMQIIAPAARTAETELFATRT
jgi:predicted DNA-binding protein with PD1-like motif